MLAHGGSWADHLLIAEEAINEAVHSTPGFSPIELWEGDEKMRKKAKENMDAKTIKRTRMMRKFLAEF